MFMTMSVGDTFCCGLPYLWLLFQDRLNYWYFSMEFREFR